jgi:3'(2'), 5'-bisphosphate nucleotidase
VPPRAFDRDSEEPTVPTLDVAASAGLMDELTAISISAADAIRRWDAKAGLRLKADGSPVTAADEAAESVIRDGLERLAGALPIVSEEQAEGERPSVAGGSYFLVDPLDGTREFIAGRDEYTINIAIVTDGVPVLGVITAPALGLLWRGIVGRGAERIVLAGGDKSLRPQAIQTRPRAQRELVAMVSRSHLEPRTQAYLDRLPQAKLVACGSAVKFCRLAEGSADLYPRLAPTHDWDVAAGHAVLKAAGGSVVAPEGGPIVYGSAALIIPGFLAWGDSASANRSDA